MGITGDEAGTALKSGISRIFRIGEEGFEDAGKAEEMLNSIGVAVRDSKGEFLDFPVIIQNTSQAFQSLTNTQKMAVAQAIGGTHHYSKYISLLNNFDIATRATESALNSQGSAMNENEKYIQSVSGQFQILQTNMEGVKQKVLTSDDLKGFLGFANGLVEATQGFISFKVVIAGVATAILLLNKNYRACVSGLSLSSISQTITSMGLLKGMVHGVKTAFDMAKISSALFNAVLTMGISYIVTTGIQAISSLVDKLITTKSELREMNEEMSNFVKETGKNYGEVNKLVSEQEKLEKSLASGKLTTEEATLAQQQLADTQKRIAEILPSATTELNSQSEALATNIELTKQLNEEQKQAMADKGVEYFNKNSVTQDSIDSQIEKYQQAKKEYQALQLALKQGKEQITIKEDFFSQVSGQWEIRDKVVNVKEELAKFGDVVKEQEVELRRLAEMLNAINQAYGEDVFKIDMSAFNNSIDTNTQKVLSNTKAKEENANAPIPDYSKQYEEASDSLDKITGKLEFYNKALKELDDGELSRDTFNTILSDYPQLLGYLDDETTLRNEINRLIGEEENAQQNTYSKMLSLSEQYYNAKIRGNGDMNTQLLQMYSDFGGKLGEGYKIDLNNYKNLEQAKADMTTKLLQSLAGSWASYWQDSVGDFSDEMWYGLRYNPEETKRLEGIRDKIKAMQDKFKNITIDPISIDVGSVGGGSGGKGGSDSSKKDIADIESKTDKYYQFKDAIEKVNNALDLNKQKQERDGKSVQLLEEEISLLGKKKQAVNDLWYEQEQEKIRLEKWLSDAGKFTFEDGQITNLNSQLDSMANRVNSSSGDAKEQAKKDYEEFVEYTKRYTELVNKDLADSNKQWLELGKTISEVNKEILNFKIDNLFSGYEKGITQLEEKLADLDLKGMFDENDNDTAKMDIVAQKYKIIQDEIQKTQYYMEDLTKQKATSAEEQDILNNKYRDAQNDLRNYQKELEGTKDAMRELQIAMMETALEKDIFGGMTEGAYEDQVTGKINKIRDQIESLRSAWKAEADAKELAERRAEITKLQTQLQHLQNNSLTSLTEEQAKALDLDKERERVLEHQAEIQELQIQLSNLQKQENIQNFTKLDDGSFDFKYVADKKAIDEVNKEISDKQKDFDKWRQDTLESVQDTLKSKIEDFDQWQLEKQREAQIARLEQQIKAEEDDLKIRKEAFEKLKKEIRDNYDPKNPNSLTSITNKGLSDLNAIYDGKFKEMIEIIRTKTNEASSYIKTLMDYLAQIKSLNSAIASAELNNMANSYTPNSVAGFQSFDTGGMTVGNGFAMLHDKEIVLNKTDTSNFLKAIKESTKLIDILSKFQLPSFKMPTFERKDTGNSNVYHIDSLELKTNIDNNSGVDRLIESLGSLSRLTTMEH